MGVVPVVVMATELATMGVVLDCLEGEEGSAGAGAGVTTEVEEVELLDGTRCPGLGELGTTTAVFAGVDPDEDEDVSVCEVTVFWPRPLPLLPFGGSSFPLVSFFLCMSSGEPGLLPALPSLSEPAWPPSSSSSASCSVFTSALKE